MLSTWPGQVCVCARACVCECVCVCVWWGGRPVRMRSAHTDTCATHTTCMCAVARAVLHVRVCTLPLHYSHTTCVFAGAHAVPHMRAPSHSIIHATCMYAGAPHSVPHVRAPSQCVIISCINHVHVHTQCRTCAHLPNTSYTYHMHVCSCTCSAAHARALPLHELAINRLHLTLPLHEYVHELKCEC